MMHAIFELLLANACLFILYKSDPQRRIENLIWVLLAVSCAANAVSGSCGMRPANTLSLEHYLIAIGIAVKFLWVLKHEFQHQ